MGKAREAHLIHKGNTPGGTPQVCAVSSGRVFMLRRFWSENGYTLCPFLSGMVFDGTTECMNVFIVSIPNE